MILRQARVNDVPAIHVLIGRQAEKGAMLPRSRARLYEMVREFLVIEDDDRPVGCGALRVLWEDLGEICSIAVEESHRKLGAGTLIIDGLISQAILLGLKKIFVLTYIPGFFGRFGFTEVDKHTLPHKVWADCVNCPKFPDCGEIAMMREL